MNKSEAERQRAYRERMYSAGYKQMSIWVPRESEGKTEKIERKVFLRRIEALTAGWPKSKLNKFFRDVLKIINEKIEEDKKEK